ncbi:L-serine ammonia-lyase, iron-sulfur-dependent, subunit alpha [Candidatus Fermentibacteria bacterium]|nr:L-serine ammonia-lyase, iron-sulfur-dependent, subunit alpha [Candidatus Fermentibacteria bacterium]
MNSIRELFRIGRGPSSSHTMGPRTAAERFALKYPDAYRFRATLFGSLAATGKGHLADRAVSEALAPREVEILWRAEVSLSEHPNGMRFEALDASEGVLGAWQGYSVGGGAIREEGIPAEERKVYSRSTMTEILTHCEERGLAFWEYVMEQEGDDILQFLQEVWHVMATAIDRGLRAEGVLPGSLGLPRRAWSFYRRAAESSPYFQRRRVISAYALAVAEENAAGGEIVTAPTCGASGVLPAALRAMQEETDCGDDVLLRALATAGLIGNIVKHNGSISGAEVGCQGEIGTACAMASGAATKMLGGSIHQIEYAAETGLEHHLGLTCDPVAGLVQIPCIERNVFAASRAFACADFALLTDGRHRISFDEVVKVMVETGRDLLPRYRETAGGGLAGSFARRPRPVLAEP